MENGTWNEGKRPRTEMIFIEFAFEEVESSLWESRILLLGQWLVWDQPEVYKSYKTKLVRSVELKPIIDQEEESEILTENFPLLQMQTQ